MSSGPNPVAAAWSMLRARRVAPPRPLLKGRSTIDHAGLADILDTCLTSGVRSLPASTDALETYRDAVAMTDPDSLGSRGALAYWINLYNAGALWTAGHAFDTNTSSVLRIPGTFSNPWVSVQGESLSLDDIEHGKIRRFGDPRIHGALVCGSVSCPTLRREPYVASSLDHQLDDQLRFFVAQGGGRLSRNDNTVWLSSVFKWYGRDFTLPHRMPSIIPARQGRVRDILANWFPPNDASYIWLHQPQVMYMPYDWGLGCSVA